MLMCKCFVLDLDCFTVDKLYTVELYDSKGNFVIVIDNDDEPHEFTVREFNNRFIIRS